MPAERRATRFTVSIETLREVIAEQRRGGVSMRQIATAVGIGTTTLWQIVRGAVPRPRTHGRLADWYLRLRADRVSGDERPQTDAELAAAALDALTRHVPPEARATLERQLLRVLESAPWLGALKSPEH